MMAYRFGGATAGGMKSDIVFADWPAIISVADQEAEVNLPGDLSPTVHEDGLVGLPFLRLNTTSLGVGVDGQGLLEAWLRLQERGMPMDRLALGLLWLDIMTILRGLPAATPGLIHYYYPAIPAYAQALKFAGLVGQLERFPQSQCSGSERIVGGAQRTLKRLLGRTQLDDPSYGLKVTKAYEELASKISELDVLTQLLRLNYVCILPKAGADFAVMPEPAIRLEVKSRSDHGGGFLKKLAERQATSTPITPQSYLALLCWYAFSQAKRAFEKQQSEVLVCDITHTFPGPFLSAAADLWGLDQDIGPALRSAVDGAREGEKSVVVLTSVIGLEHRWQAKALQKADVDRVGGLLWNLNKRLGLDAEGLAQILV